MRYLLDTNACIAYLRQPGSHIRTKLESLDARDVYICTPVLAELFYGAYRSGDVAKNQQLIEELLNTVQCVAFDSAAALVVGRIRAELASIGQLIGPYDLQIAGIAIAGGYTLVTHNQREFSRIAELSLEDWMA